MLKPEQFAPNDAWIVFRLNEAPVSTDEDGDFNVLCLMDAASCYILGGEFVPVQGSVAPEDAIARLVQTGLKEAGCVAATFYLSSELESGHVAALVEDLGSECLVVNEDELTVYTSEARESFLEHMGCGRLQ